MIPDHEIVARRVPRGPDDPLQVIERHYRQRHYDDNGVLRREDHFGIKETPLPLIRGPTSAIAWLGIGLLVLAAIVVAYIALLLFSVAASWGVAYQWGWQAGLGGFVVCLILSLLWGPCGPFGLIVFQVLMAIGVLVAGWHGMVLATLPASLVMVMGLHYGGTHEGR
ncbi:MAG: hypothetical protein EA350_05350 [Gemmatimonadales bacterium]|nr:MAG: hypothetical protein EA350_05350 [Gemmatimonadales bacterium]